MIKAVIFDMDGVIVDSVPVHFKAWQKTFAEKFNVKLSKQYFLKHLNGRRGPESIKIVTGKNISYAKRLKITQLKDKYSRQNFHNIKSTPGLINFLKFLKKHNIKTAIATSAQPKTKNYFIKTLKLQKYFDAVICASDVTKSKPHPQVFLKAAKALGVKPQQAAIIEDAPLGIKAGKTGKFKLVIGITTSQPTKDLKQADFIIKNFNNKKIKQIIKPPIILASKSPARKKILKKYIKNFSVKISHIQEKKIKIKNPKKLTLKLAQLKAEKISKKNPLSIVIGTDTLGAMNNKIYGKPKTKKNYFRFVKEHSQNKIAVITGWHIIDGINNKQYSGVETSWVHFNKITDQMAENYFTKYNPLEKGGGFNIEEVKKLGFVKKITGDYNNIIGLPQSVAKKIKNIL